MEGDISDGSRSDYEKLRERNMKRNADFLKTIIPRPSQYFDEIMTPEMAESRLRERRPRRHFDEIESHQSETMVRTRRKRQSEVHNFNSAGHRNVSDSSRNKTSFLDVQMDSGSQISRAPQHVDGFKARCCVWAEHPNYEGWWPASVVKEDQSGIIVCWDSPDSDEPTLLVPHSSVIPRVANSSSCPVWLKDRKAISEYAQAAIIEERPTTFRDQNGNSNQPEKKSDAQASTAGISPRWDEAKQSLIEPLVATCGDISLWYQDPRFTFEGTPYLDCSKEQLHKARAAVSAQSDLRKVALSASLMLKSLDSETMLNPDNTWECMLQLSKDLQQYYLTKTHHNLNNVGELLIKIMQSPSNLLQNANASVLQEIECFVFQKQKSILFLKVLVEKLVPLLKDHPLARDLHTQVQDMEQDKTYVMKMREIFCVFEQHYVCELDYYSLSERIIASGPAIEIVRTILFSPIMKKLQTIIWKLLTRNAVALNWFVVFESATNILTVWIANKVQWSSQFKELNIFKLMDKKYLTAGDSTSKPYMNFPLVNTDEFCNLLQVSVDCATRVSHKRFTRHLGKMQSIWALFSQSIGTLGSGALEYQARAGFLYVAESCPSLNRIQGDVISPNPVSGLCLAKAINISKAAQLFNAGHTLDDFVSLETARQVYLSEELSTLGNHSSIDISNVDKFQASLDSFSSLPNTFSKRQNPCNSVSKTVLNHSKSPRNILVKASLAGSVQVVAQLLVGSLNRSLSQSRYLSATSRYFENTDLYSSDQNLQLGISKQKMPGCKSLTSMDNDDEYHADVEQGQLGFGSEHENEDVGTDPGLSFQEHCHELENGRYAYGDNDPADTKFCSSSALTDSLSSLKIVRYVQVDISRPDTSCTSGTLQNVQELSYMLIMPDVVDVRGQLSLVNKPVATIFVERGNVNSSSSISASTWCLCTCEIFKSRSTALISTEEHSMTFWFYQRLTKVYNFAQIPGCSHTAVTTEWIRETFLNSIKIWSTETSILKIVLPSCKELQSSRPSMSIAFTYQGGRDPVGNEDSHNIPIVPITFGSNLKPIAFSIDVPSTEVRHAFLIRSNPKHSNLKVIGQDQMTCSMCGSKLLALGSNRYCAHLNAWNCAADSSFMSPQKETSARVKSSKKTALFNPDMCSNTSQKATGYLFPYTYTQGKIPFDYTWDARRKQIVFGDLKARQLSDKQTKLLHGYFPIQRWDGNGSCFQVDCELILGGCPSKCPICCIDSPEENILNFKTRNITLFTADKAIVSTKIKCWRCEGCKLDVQNNGIEDGFWFHSKNVAVSMKIIWDLLTLQVQGMESDFTSFLAHCEQQTQARMGDKTSKFLGIREFRDVYFAMLASCTIRFNQPCFGCWLSLKDDFPISCDPEEIINCEEPPPIAARDISHVGMDGLANYMTRGHGMSRMQNEDTFESTSKQKAGPKEKKKEHPLLQHDRCPIKIVPANNLGGEMETSKNATAAQKKNASKTKELFKTLGNQLKDISRAEIEAWEKMTNNMAHSSDSLIAMCKLDLCKLKPLLMLCVDTGEVLHHFKQQKATRFLFNCGDLFGQIGSAASILTLLKPTLVPDCLAFSRAFENQEKDGDCGLSNIGLIHAALRSQCSPGSTEFPAAFTLFILLDFFDPAIRTEFQNKVNASIVSAISFVAMRCTEVMESHALRTGRLPTDLDESCMEEYPVPIRVFGRDVETIWPDKLLGVNIPNDATCDPVANNGFYSFTVHGKPVRTKSSDNASGNLFCQESSSDCKKPSWKHQNFTSRTNFKQMLFTTFCVVHSIFMGYHIIEGGEGRKDPYNALFLFKETCPQSISYDFACGAFRYWCLALFKHDAFHGSKGHKCSTAMRWSPYKHLVFRHNTSVMEQANAFLVKMRKSISRMNGIHAHFMIQMLMYCWNLRKLCMLLDDRRAAGKPRAMIDDLDHDFSSTLSNDLSDLLKCDENDEQETGSDMERATASELAEDRGKMDGNNSAGEA